MKKIKEIAKLFILPTKITENQLLIGSNTVVFRALNQTFPTKEKFLWLEVNGRTPFLVSLQESNEDIAWKINAMF